MKKILKITAIVMVVCVLSVSCNKFLETKPNSVIEADEAIVDAKSVVTATAGVYVALRSNSYYGRAFPVVNDIAGDIVTKRYQPGATNNWFDAFENYTTNESTAELSSLWQMMYRTIERATRNIQAANRLMADGIVTNEDDIKTLKACIAQCYAAKALSTFNLVNLFALPYSAENASKYGVPLVGDIPLTENDKPVRNTIEEDYKQILDNLDSAKNYWEEAGYIYVFGTDGDEWMTLNITAVNAIEARVRLYKKDYEGAASAAQIAIDLAIDGNRRIILGAEEYYDMWTKNEPSVEDIFALPFNETEATGTTSIGHFYGKSGSTYGGRLARNIYDDKLKESDLRRSIIVLDAGYGNSYRVLKYNGGQNGVISNIHVIRLPELYLILAESYNNMPGKEIDVQNELFEVAQRDTAYKLPSDLPTGQVLLANFIRDERIREFMYEGHRWMDMRRTNELLSKDRNNSITVFKNFDVSKFTFTIPSAEINVTNLPQNEIITPTFE